MGDGIPEKWASANMRASRHFFRVFFLWLLFFAQAKKSKEERFPSLS
jgi:hypothetical protein